MTKKKVAPKKRRAVRRRTTQPVVRPVLRNGRASFLRALRGKLAKVSTRIETHGAWIEKEPNNLKLEMLEIVDAAIARYKGD